MKKQIKLLFLVLVLTFALVACNQAAPANNDAPAETAAPAEEATSHEMSYISTEDTKAIIDEGKTDDYILLDVRKAADYESDHVDGFISADLDAAKNGDTANGVETLKAALEGKDVENKEILLMCYSGAGYAQVGTDLLINELNIKPENIKTVEGGMKAW